MNMPGRIGIIGGGQLGRMLTIAAKQAGHQVTVLDPVPDSPAGQVADRQIVSGFGDESAMRTLFACSDVVTYEREQIDTDLLLALEAEGHVTRPSASTLAWIQDKFIQKTRLRDRGVPVPDFMEVRYGRDLSESARRFGYPFVLKCRRGGYDGKGIEVVRNAADVQRLSTQGDGLQLMAERYVDFAAELSVMLAFTSDGEMMQYPIAQNVHEGGILKLTMVPAGIPAEVAARVHATCQRAMRAISDTGVFCIELFLTTEGDVLVNEIAPRPHNSGHYTIEACATSQYAQLVRMLTGLGPGSTGLRSPCAMGNLLGPVDVSGPYRVDGLCGVAGEADLHVHLYGKADTGHRKKLGHVTVLDAHAESATARCLSAVAAIRILPAAPSEHGADGDSGRRGGHDGRHRDGQ